MILQIHKVWTEIEIWTFYLFTSNREQSAH